MDTDSTIQAPLTAEVDGFIGWLNDDLGEHWVPAAPKCIARPTISSMSVANSPMPG